MDIDEIIEKVANHFGYTTEDVMRKDKSHKVSHARNFIFYVLHAKCGLSIGTISKRLNRSQSHIKHQNATIKYRVENFKEYKDTYSEIEASL